MICVSLKENVHFGNEWQSLNYRTKRSLVLMELHTGTKMGSAVPLVIRVRCGTKGRQGSIPLKPGVYPHKYINLRLFIVPFFCHYAGSWLIVVTDRTARRQQQVSILHSSLQPCTVGVNKFSLLVAPRSLKSLFNV
jgi:hypothetical protein